MRETKRHRERKRQGQTDRKKKLLQFRITVSQINMGSPKSVDLPIVSFSPEYQIIFYKRPPQIVLTLSFNLLLSVRHLTFQSEFTSQLPS